LLNYKDGIYDKLPEKEVLAQATAIFTKIIKETDRATGITKRLSTFAKPNTHFQITEVDVLREVNEVLGILGHELKLENVEIELSLPEKFPKIMADRKELQEVLFNILRNAAQALEGSGKIIIGGQRNGTRATVAIKDFGPGITPDKMEKIFHPFFTTKDPGKGTGLGLFIVKQIVERNEGTITVQSQVGKGTEFVLSFRLAKSELDPALSGDQAAKHG
jgi:signal transduction histidine kinase